MNKIKALLHNKVLYKLSNEIKDYEYIIVDQFAESYVYFNWSGGIVAWFYYENAGNWQYAAWRKNKNNWRHFFPDLYKK